MLYALDTNTVSFLFRRNPRVESRLSALPPETIAIPVTLKL